MYVIILWEHCLCHPDSLNIHKLTNMLSSIWWSIITLGREGIPRNYADRVENVSLHSTPWTVVVEDKETYAEQVKRYYYYGCCCFFYAIDYIFKLLYSDCVVPVYPLTGIWS